MKINLKIIFNLVSAFCIAACSGGGDKSIDPNFSGYPNTPFTITDESELIGGPVAQGRIGDVLLENDGIRVIIQKPAKNAGVNSFGGNIIDADLVRSAGQQGQDNFGSLFPLVNIEWTVNYYDYEVISDGSNNDSKVLRAYGMIDVYDYLDLDFIGEVAESIAGQKIHFSNRFDDRRNPFTIYDDLKGMDHKVVTDYILEPGKNYVRIETTFNNPGKEDVKFPVGQFLNGSGQVSMLIPGIGFSPDLMTQVGDNTPAIIYAGFDGVDVSYGYFFDPSQFKNPETKEFLTTTSVSYSGVSGVMFGEEFLKLAPLGGGDPTINFSVPAGESKTVTSYFVVGNGSAGSVLDAGLSAVGAMARPVSGIVYDADGQAVEGATVAVMAGSSTLITYRTDASGNFSGTVPTGGNAVSRQFGNGTYKVAVDVPGYHLNTTSDSGKCEPDTIDMSVKDTEFITCTLGETGTIELVGPVIDDETGEAIAARLTIVGDDPSPNKVGTAGRFRSAIHWEPIFGIVDVKYIAANGTFDLTGKTSFNLEPGTYRFVISHGPEYTSYDRVIDVSASGKIALTDISLHRAVKTPGYISADLHVHSITSPDSNLLQELRALSASAEGLDVLQSTDHDFLTDFGPYVSSLMARGLIPDGSIKTSVGDEVTPNHYGHLNVFPLEHDHEDPAGGAVDWSYSNKDEVSPAPDYVMTLDELIEKLREDPGEEVVQINHIMDNPTGLLLATGWVTSTYYMDTHGVSPLSSYADPVERRMPPRSSGTSFPLDFGTSGLVTTNFDVMELTIGQHQHDGDSLFRSALPTWFNMLNLGFRVAATADSDSHRSAANPMGLPRNFIASSIDPMDGMGDDHSAIDLEEYAINIRAGKVTVSAGPIVMMYAEDASGVRNTIGDTYVGSKLKMVVEVNAPSWAWFDTIEIYMNTDPIPVDDDTDVPMQGVAADPAQFYRPYHMPRYTYSPTKSFSLSDGTLESWRGEGGVISAKVSFDVEVDHDTWIVAMARGTRKTEGYRSLFPIVPNVLRDKGEVPETFDVMDLSEFHSDRKVGASAWGFTNPIYIDVDGDGFEAKYVREGLSPL